MDSRGELIKLKERINHFVELHLPKESDIGGIKRSKIIHDSTWGTNKFERHEIEIINTALFQRLRDINQMGFVDYVYPSARHSRFEHSLGVTTIVSRMVDAINRKEEGGKIDNNLKISVRLSALLHDVGHCLFSHTSELVYGAYLEGFMEEVFNNDNIKNPSAHEFFSYLIITSVAFKSYFRSLCEVYDLHCDIDEVALRIIGRHKEGTNRVYTELINGPIDADKLDYFHRDSQFSGIPIQLDIDRLFHEINIPAQIERSNDNITVSKSGISCIEQIIFNKMVLHSTIYTHQKVQAIDCMFKGVFEYIMKNDIEIQIGDSFRTIENPDDFLYLTDYYLFALADSTNDVELKKLINNIRSRKLLKRAFIINRKSLTQNATSNSNAQETIEEIKRIKKNGDKTTKEQLDLIDGITSAYDQSTQKTGLSGIIKLLDQGETKIKKQDYLRDLAKKIYNRATQLKGSELSYSYHEVWIDMPKSPSSKEIQNMMVRTNRGNQSEYKSIDNYFPFAQYEDLYENNRLNGHIFAPDHDIEHITKASKEVLEAELKVTFNEHSTHDHK